jgi:hypothetical protein
LKGERKSRLPGSTSVVDPTATLAMHCGNVFDVGSSPYQNASLSR